MVDKVVVLADLREDFFEQEPGIGVGERNILCATLVVDLFAAARIDEDADGYRHFALVNQVVENGRRPHGPFQVDVGLAVLEDHHASGLGVGVLGGHIDPVIVGRVGIDATVIPDVFCHHALRDAILRQ